MATNFNDVMKEAQANMDRLFSEHEESFQEKMRMLTLQEELRKASESYYNTGVELMSNYEYDKLFDELRQLEEKLLPEGAERFTSSVGSTTSKLSKVTHEYEAKSLGKTKDIDEVIGVHNNSAHANVCVSWKLDGSTVQLTYEGGRLLLAGTRGDGSVGQDITRNASFIAGIPKTIPYEGKLVVRGEALMSYAEFERLNALANGMYANARNLANATITVENTFILRERKTEFHAFEMVYADEKINSFADRLTFLAKCGFMVVDHERVNVSELKQTIAKWSKEDTIRNLGVPVDGLVIVNDDCDYTNTLKGTGHHPHLMKGMAFKWQDETAETTLRDIEWQVGRTGVLTPVAVFDTVDLCGTKVSKASLHNVSYIIDKDLRIGDKITVYKANMIIPQVAENLSANNARTKKLANYKMPNWCPCCDKPVKLNENNRVVTLSCENERCPEKEIGRLTHFASKHGLNIEGLSENTIALLVDKGFVREYADLYSLEKYRTELVFMDGFGEKSVDKLLKAIEASRDTDFEHFMYACGIENFGRGQIKVLKTYLDENYDTLTAQYPNVDGSYDLMGLLFDMVWANRGHYDFTQIEGIGDVLSDNLNAWVTKHLILTDETKVQNVLRELRFHDKQKTIERSGNALNGKSFCITGSLETFANRDEAFAYITDNGGKTASGVSAKTNYLVNNDITSTSGKNKKAKELGVPIITEAQLRDAVERGIDLPSPTKKTIERE